MNPLLYALPRRDDTIEVRMLGWLARSLPATGTPEGVGAARQPPEFLEAGDVVEA